MLKGFAVKKSSAVMPMLVGLLVLAMSLILSPAIAAQATGSTLSVNRISGQDRYATAISVAQAGYPDSAPIVFVATGTIYPDALAASPVAAKLGGPLLLTTPRSLPADVGVEIAHLDPATIVVVGGTGAVSPSVSNELGAEVPTATLTRIGGADRFATAAAIDHYGFPSASGVYITTGNNYPDALSAAAAAGAHQEPVLLVNGTASGLDTQTKDLVAALGVKHATIVGGPRL